QQVPAPPRLADGARRVGGVDRADDLRPDRLAVPEARLERQPVFAVEIRQILAHLRNQRPRAEEGDLVEPAALAGRGMGHHCAPALPRAQHAVGTPLELDLVAAAVLLDGTAIVAA